MKKFILIKMVAVIFVIIYQSCLLATAQYSNQYSYLKASDYKTPYMYSISSKNLSFKPILSNFFAEKGYSINCVSVKGWLNQEYGFIEVKREFIVTGNDGSVSFNLSFSFFPSQSYISYVAITETISKVKEKVSTEFELKSIDGMLRFKHVSPALFQDKEIGSYSYELWPASRIKRNMCMLHVICGNIIYVFTFTETANNLAFEARKLAWELDQYLKGDPLEKFSDEEKQKLKTLEITLPNETEFEQGKEYPIDFPRKLPDGSVPAEIRLVVSRGEIQQVIDKETAEDGSVFPNPASLAPDIDGKYTVLFGQPNKQTVHCYHINEEGKCLAWGEIEVFVRKSKNSETE